MRYYLIQRNRLIHEYYFTSCYAPKEISYRLQVNIKTVYRVISKGNSSDTRRNNEIKVVKNENHEPLNK